MNIQEYASKIKMAYENQDIEARAKGRRVYSVLIVILLASASFGLGRLSAGDASRVPVKVVDGHDADVSTPLDGKKVVPEPSFVADTDGNNYYFLWCDGAARIKENRRRYFTTMAAAAVAGFEPAGECEGLR